MGAGKVGKDIGAHFLGFSGFASTGGKRGEVDVDFKDREGVVCSEDGGWVGGWGGEGGERFEDKDADGEEGGGGDDEGGLFLEGG